MPRFSGDLQAFFYGWKFLSSNGSSSLRDIRVRVRTYFLNVASLVEMDRTYELIDKNHQKRECGSNANQFLLPHWLPLFGGDKETFSTNGN